MKRKKISSNYMFFTHDYSPKYWIVDNVTIVYWLVNGIVMIVISYGLVMRTEIMMKLHFTYGIHIIE